MEEFTAGLVDHRWGSEAPGRAWLGFDAGGRLYGSDGCNRLMGQWRVAGDQVVFGRVASTMMFCEGVDTWLAGAAAARLVRDGSGEWLEVSDAAGRVIGVLERGDRDRRGPALRT